MKYKFITFEGVEGCGKSTQSKLLFNFLQQKNIAAILTREPGGTPVAEEIRAILINGAVNKLDGISETLLNFAARRNHVEKLIKPNLHENKVIISDRFFDSTFAYQGYGHGENLQIIKDIQKSSIGNFAPDITFLIDVDITQTLERIKSRSENNRYENMNLEFHQKVRRGFLEIAKENSERFRIINGTKSIAEIHQEILENLNLI